MRTRSREGCRFVVDIIDSGREYVRRTGRPSFHAANARYGCTDRSSLLPNPPPTAVGLIRTASSVRPRIASSSVPVHVRGLRRHLHLNPIADALRVPGLWLDVRVLDEARLELALDLDVGGRERLVQIAATNVASDQNVT